MLNSTYTSHHGIYERWLRKPPPQRTMYKTRQWQLGMNFKSCKLFPPQERKSSSSLENFHFSHNKVFWFINLVVELNWKQSCVCNAFELNGINTEVCFQAICRSLHTDSKLLQSTYWIKSYKMEKIKQTYWRTA